MTFANDALLTTSERFFLVRITARKYVGLGSPTGNPNEYGFNVTEGLLINSIIVNGAVVTTYVYVEDELIVTTPVNLAISDNVMTIDHDIFLTGTTIRETVGVAGLPDAVWQPLIENYPDFSQSMRNIAEGVFSLSNTDIDLVCTNRWVQNLLGQNDSLSKAPVSCWVCIDTASSNRKIFDGEISSVNYSYGKVKLKIIDTFQKLSNTASFGTRSQSHIYTGNAGQYPLPQDENAILPITLGKSSPYTLAYGYKHIEAFGTPPGALYHVAKAMRCKLIGPQNPKQTDTTTWAAGRIAGTDIKRINFGTIIGNTFIYRLEKVVQGAGHQEEFGNPGVYYTITDTSYIYNEILYIQLANINDFTGEIGDYIPKSYLPAAYSNSVGGFICGYGAGLYGSYNLAIAVLNNSADSIDGFSRGNGTTSALSIPNNTLPSMSVFVEAGQNIDYNYDSFTNNIGATTFKTRFSFVTQYLPFTLSLGSAYTIGGKTVRNVYFTVPAYADVNISTSQVRCRYSPNQSMTHGEAMKFICKASGLETNDATFTQADVDLSANVSMTIPMAEEANDFGKYLEAAQAVASSTLGILRVNQSRQVEYELIKDPNLLTIDSVKTSINMLSGDTSSLTEFQDIYTTIEFENKQLNNIAAISGNGPKAAIEFPINRQLHRVERTKTVEHVLESIQNRKNAIAGYYSSPTVEYTLATASEDLASNIGDVVEINNTAVANESETAVGIIVGLDQSGSKTTVKINEIRGV